MFFHGGPGAGTSPGNRNFFDPTFYRIILFDQVCSLIYFFYSSIRLNSSIHMKYTETRSSIFLILIVVMLDATYLIVSICLFCYIND